MVYCLDSLTCILFGVISVIKFFLHSERIILLSMSHKAYLSVYYFYYSIRESGWGGGGGLVFTIH